MKKREEALSFRVPKDLKKKIESYATKQGLSVSEAARKLVETTLTNEPLIVRSGELKEAIERLMEVRK